jgi:hypothetical protein
MDYLTYSVLTCWPVGDASSSFMGRKQVMVGCGVDGVRE